MVGIVAVGSTNLNLVASWTLVARLDLTIKQKSLKQLYQAGASNLFATQAMDIELDAAFCANNRLATTLDATFQDPEVVEQAVTSIIINKTQLQFGLRLGVSSSYGFEMKDFYGKL